MESSLQHSCASDSLSARPHIHGASDVQLAGVPDQSGFGNLDHPGLGPSVLEANTIPLQPLPPFSLPSCCAQACAHAHVYACTRVSQSRSADTLTLTQRTMGLQSKKLGRDEAELAQELIVEHDQRYGVHVGVVFC